jgi:hypothetical protein
MILILALSADIFFRRKQNFLFFKADDVSRMNEIITSRKTTLYLFAYDQACLIIRFVHSARSTSEKNINTANKIHDTLKRKYPKKNEFIFTFF